MWVVQCRLEGLDESLFDGKQSLGGLGEVDRCGGKGKKVVVL